LGTPSPSESFAVTGDGDGEADAGPAETGAHPPFTHTPTTPTRVANGSVPGHPPGVGLPIVADADAKAVVEDPVRGDQLPFTHVPPPRLAYGSAAEHPTTLAAGVRPDA
jgi:hypothetical protein